MSQEGGGERTLRLDENAGHPQAAVDCRVSCRRGGAMRRVPLPALVLALAILLTLDAAPSASSATAASATPSNTEDLLRRMATEAPDDCDAPAPSRSSSAEVNQLENQLFQTVKAVVAEQLNAAPPASSSNAGSRAVSALREVEQSSQKVNKSWPDEARFHFKVLDLSPAILIDMTYRNRAVFVLFGSYYLDKYAALDPGTKWREVGFADPGSASNGIDLFPLHRGPNGRVRLLAKVWQSGCAGSVGEDYYGYEWSPSDGQIAAEIIKIEGAEGLDEAASMHAGKLNTTGKTIQLPYCFYSAVDTWDNPTLCAADSFDLSGDNARFSGRVYNRPDLVTVARAVQYAEIHDYLALRGYCASAVVARRLLSEVPPNLFAETLDTVKVGPGRERVVLADGSVQFDLIERRSTWLVEAFTISADNR